MDDNAPETILTTVTDILEEQSKILQAHRQAIELLLGETKKIKQRLDKLELADSLDSSDAKFLKDVITRLEDISKVIANTSLETV
jgi:uncharacterized alpha-E superfamily protein